MVKLSDEHLQKRCVKSFKVSDAISLLELTLLSIFNPSSNQWDQRYFFLLHLSLHCQGCWRFDAWFDTYMEACITFGHIKLTKIGDSDFKISWNVHVDVWCLISRAELCVRSSFLVDVIGVLFFMLTQFNLQYWPELLGHSVSWPANSVCLHLQGTPPLPRYSRTIMPTLYSCRPSIPTLLCRMRGGRERIHTSRELCL